MLVVPGSHRGPVLDHHQDGCFVGAITDRAAAPEQTVQLTVPAGGISLHHVRTVHGSVPYNLSAYFGVTPSERSSADVVRYGRITKTGSPTIRWLLSEAVLTHVTHVDTDISRFYLRLRKEMPAKKALVATVSKLLRIVYWMLKKNLSFVNCLAEGGAEFKGCVRRTAASRLEEKEDV